jgi:predicted phage baseplate assembly protein
MRCSCGCCAGVRTETPVPIVNPPGRSAIAYRAGTHGQFLASQLARLSSRRYPELAGLTTREPDDAAIALLDGWAVIADVLTFYQERIANEGYLRTATEQESLNALGRLVGYEPRPALGSSTYLAYTVDPGARTTVPSGSQCKSTPGPGEQPQSFETSEDLDAREEWNELKVRRTQPPALDFGDISALSQLDLAGLTVNAKPGDRMVFVFDETNADTPPVVKIVRAATVDFERSRTTVSFRSAQPLAEYDAALVELADAVSDAKADAPDDPFASRIVTTYLDVLLSEYLDALPNSRPAAGYFARQLHAILTLLAEERQIAEVRVIAPVLAWSALDGVIEAGYRTLDAAIRTARISHPEVEQLRDAADNLACGPCTTTDLLARPQVRAAGGGDCPNAYALVGLLPVLPALRKSPSRPPAGAKALTRSPSDLFGTESDTLPRLLAAADPRIAESLYQALANTALATPSPLAGLEILRQRAKPFGANAPAPPSSPAPPSPPVPAPPRENGDDEPEPPALAAVNQTDHSIVDLDPKVLPLDASYEGITVGGLVVIERPDRETLVTRITKVEEVSLVRYNLTGPSTQLTLADPWIEANADFSKLRVTAVHLRGDGLEVAEDPVADDVGGNEIELDRLYDGLMPGRWLVVSGERTDIPFTTGVSASELVMLGGVRQTVDPVHFGERTHATLVLANALAYTYRRSTVRVLGNVVEATQGENRTQVLGSGDATRPNQSFTLSQSPVTRLPAVTPSGAESTLSVRVNGMRWHETDGLVWLGPTDHGYVTRSASDGGTVVTFGDGRQGARLPTGTENVVAGFRLGAGKSGNVRAGAINQAISRPFGVNAVINPLPATGGTDADGAGDARVTIPLRVTALDRLVSVRDYEDFTRARAGIGKAAAVELADGDRQVVHVTIAGAGDAPIDPSSRLFRALEAALAEFGELHLPVRVDIRELVLIVLSANIAVLPDHSWELVEPAVRAALLDRFSFAARELGRPAYLSEGLAAMQGVEGVDYVDVDVFGHVPGDADPTELVSIAGTLTGASPCVPAHPARSQEHRHLVQDGETLTWIARRYGLTVAELLRLNPGVDSAQLGRQELLVRKGILPAQLAVLTPAVPETLILRRIPS